MKNIIRQLLVFFVFVVSLNLPHSCSEAFPVRADQWQRCSKRRGASQQRDCPGFTPDSLFIPLLA